MKNKERISSSLEMGVVKRVLIETYRDWEIYFDTDGEDFYTVSNEYDTQEKKRSYASTKKFIDDYIKDNFEFKPIKVQRMPSMFNGEKIITLTGMRKDGRFMYVDKDGKKGQMSSYDERDYFLVDERNDEAFKKIDEIRGNIKKLEKESLEVEKTVIKHTVVDIRNNLFGEQ